MSIEAKGEGMPAASNDTPDNRALNRRVTIDAKISLKQFCWVSVGSSQKL